MYEEVRQDILVITRGVALPIYVDVRILNILADHKIFYQLS